MILPVTPEAWWLAAVVALVGAAAFALVAGALRGVSPARLVETLGPARAVRFERILANRPRLLLTVGVVRGLLDAAATVSMAFALLPGAVDAGGGAVLAAVEAVVAAGALAVVTDVLPRALGESRADALAPRALPFVAHLARLLRPAIWAVERALAAALWLAGAGPEASLADSIRDELRSVARDGETGGVLDPTAKRVIENVIGFHDVQVADVMTPRTDIMAIEADATLMDAAAAFARHGHARMPVYDGSIDRIVGVLYAKDLLQKLDDSVKGVAPHETPDTLREAPDTSHAPATITTRLARAPTVRALMRKPLLVPESLRIVDLLKELRRGKPHLAVVLDEHGGTAGIVTVEDIIEEIVGEFDDELAPPRRAKLRRLADGAWDVSAKLRVDEANAQLGLNVPEDRDYETLAGFVMTALEKVPQKGDMLARDGCTFTVTDADERRVNRLRIARV